MLTFAIICLGGATVILSLAVAWRFFELSAVVRPVSRPLAVALCCQLVGSAVIGSGCLAIAVAEQNGTISEWGGDLQSTLRLTMFMATAITTIHLSRTLTK